MKLGAAILAALCAVLIGIARSSSATVAHPSKVLVVVEENHSAAQAEAGMPYLMGLAHRYGYTASYRAVGDPSEPNYLAIAGGSTFGITTDDLPSANAPKVGNAQSVFGQALSNGSTAKVYAESMPSACDLTNAKPYVVKHDPWQFFAAERTACRAHDVSTTSLLSDAKANVLPNIGMVAPNLNDDAHDGTLAQANSWLSNRLPTVLASSDFTSGRLAVVVVFDGASGGHESAPVLAVVCDVNLSGKLVTTQLTHYSLSRWLSETVGAPPLRNAATATDMRGAFGL